MSVPFQEPLEVPPWFACPECNKPMVLLGEGGFAMYFHSVPVSCPACSASVNLWTALVHAVASNFMMNGAFAVIGAQSPSIPCGWLSMNRRRSSTRTWASPRGPPSSRPSTPQPVGFFPSSFMVRPRTEARHETVSLSLGDRSRWTRLAQPPLPAR